MKQTKDQSLQYPLNYIYVTRFENVGLTHTSNLGNFKKHDVIK